MSKDQDWIQRGSPRSWTGKWGKAYPKAKVGAFPFYQVTELSELRPLRRILNLPFGQRFSEIGHFFKITSHLLFLPQFIVQTIFSIAKKNI